MNEPSSNITDQAARKRLISWVIFPFSFFPLAALLSYDWHAMPELQMPPAASSNWIGALGDTFAYESYLLFGLAAWIVPIACLILALGAVRGRRMHHFKRAPWLISFLIAAACLCQIIGEHSPCIASLIESLNIQNAGGAFGCLLMTRFLSPLVSNFGSAIAMSVVLIISLLGSIGFSSVAQVFRNILDWVQFGRVGIKVTHPQDTMVPNNNLVPDDLAAQYQAAQAVREQAKIAAQAEKARIKAEKQAEKERIKAEKIAEKERIKAQKLAQNGTPISAAPSATASASTPSENAVQDKGPYLLPPTSLLSPLSKSTADHGDVQEMTSRLINTLKLFNIDATLAYTVQGPVVTKYALNLAPGILYSAVTKISDNLMGALHAKSLRIEAPIPGEECIGIEVPNRAPAGISFREILESEAWRNAKGELPLLFGKRADGKELVSDLASMPHMLVAGATGQGKSVCLNSLICGLLMTKTPDELKLIMVDPKMVEFTPYASLPHLIVPVITENKKVVFSLHWAVQEMEKRLKLFSATHVRNIYDYNHRMQLTQTTMFGADAPVQTDIPKTLPYIVIIIDEAADLIGQCGKEVNPDIQRITQKARAAGIHLILATQRPDAKIITGSIKANIPGRVAFKTSSAVDSRTILDETGAENLIGRGDMLFRGKDNLLVRAQGAWISDQEIASVVQFIEQHSNTQFDERFSKKLGTIKEEVVDIFADNTEDDTTSKEAAESQREQVKAEANASDFKKAVECIINTNRASISHFQRRLGWGYNHSAKIMDMLEDAGVIGPQTGAGPRQIIMDQQQLLAIFNGENTNAVNTSDTPEILGGETANESTTEATI